MRITSACVYCGVGPELLIQSRSYADFDEYAFYCNTVDRIVPGGPYSWANTQSLCKVCNFAKGTLTEAAFFYWLDRIFTHSKHRLLHCQE